MPPPLTPTDVQRRRIAEQRHQLVLERLFELRLPGQAIAPHAAAQILDQLEGRLDSNIRLDQQALDLLPGIVVDLRRAQRLRDPAEKRLAGARQALPQ